MKILANDGISQSGIHILEKNGFQVITTKVAQNQLENYINENNIDAILVKNTTQVGQELMEACPSIKLIGCENSMMDNIDVEYAENQGIHVIFPTEASSNAVAELVFAHLFGMARFLHQSNREMPLEGDTRFNELKKAYANGIELRGKTLGIIGFDTVGQQVAKTALSLGMRVLVNDNNAEENSVTVDFYNGQKINFVIDFVSKDELLNQSDFITLHILAQQNYVITESDIEKMKNGGGIINTTQGGLLNEVHLVNAIESGKVQFAGLDVFETQPTPEIQLLMNPALSLTPNIGATTTETKDRIGVELATQIVELLS